MQRSIHMYNNKDLTYASDYLWDAAVYTNAMLCYKVCEETTYGSWGHIMATLSGPALLG